MKQALVLDAHLAVVVAVESAPAVAVHAGHAAGGTRVRACAAGANIGPFCSQGNVMSGLEIQGVQ